MNNKAEAIIGAMQRTDSETVTINYNPSRGLVADGIEAAVDKFGDEPTPIAIQTGEFKREVTTVRGTDGSNFASHSQGTMHDTDGTQYIQEQGSYEDGGFKDRDYFIDANNPSDESGIPTSAHYGAAQNEDSARDIIEGVNGDRFEFVGTATHKGDMVSIGIGLNQVNSELNKEKYPDSNPHSNYECKELEGSICGNGQ